MKDLGYIPPKPEKSEGATPVTIVSDEDKDGKPQYPSLRFNGEQAEKAGLDKCAYGDEYEVTFRIKATRIGGSEWEMKKDGLPPVEFDVISCDEPKEVEAEEKSDEETEQKPKPKSRVLGPKEAGFRDDGMDG